MKTPSLLLFGATVAVAMAAGPSLSMPALASTPPPSPPPLSASPPAGPATMAPVAPGVSPQPTAAATILVPAGGAKGSQASPSASPTPPEDNRVGLSGVWEVQIQRGERVDYTHFKLVQTQNALTGGYLDKDGKKYPLSGSVDGKNVRVVVSMPDGSTILFEGKVDGTTDMLGMLTDAKENVVFTAAYRPKEKWIDNLNTQPSGLGGLNSGPGGGIPPR